MNAEIESVLSRIGGGELVNNWQEVHAKTVVYRLPTASIDSLSIGYSIALGGIASIIDVLMEISFRAEMAELHAEDAEKQTALEERVKELMEALGIEAGGNESGDPHMAMDWYRHLNELLGLESPYKLRPSNHRILNHTDVEKVIEMLMNGEAGFGNLRFKYYPKMSEAAARMLYEAHIKADMASPASLPLRFMSWLWEQGVKSKNPDMLGAPNSIYSIIQKLGPNIDWSKWINKFYGDEKLIPEGATLGDAMLKLYDSGVLNQRVFWTSDLGAAVGSLKRRAVITATMELGVELFAFLEGIKQGHIQWNANVLVMAGQIKEWRNQPKYLDMKIIAQAFASSGGVARGLIKGDILNINYFSLALMLKHVWSYPATERDHYQRIAQYASSSRAAALEEFSTRTGIRSKPDLQIIEGGLLMRTTLEDRLIKAGCHSTRVRVLASRHPVEMEPIVCRYEDLHSKVEGMGNIEERYYDLCEGWYLTDELDDQQAIRLIARDLDRLEHML
ncbi:hypothetical protein ACI2KR_08110 [Pseudomonas luteola]